MADDQAAKDAADEEARKAEQDAEIARIRAEHVKRLAMQAEFT